MTVCTRNNFHKHQGYAYYRLSSALVTVSVPGTISLESLDTRAAFRSIFKKISATTRHNGPPRILPDVLILQASRDELVPSSHALELESLCKEYHYEVERKCVTGLYTLRSCSEPNDEKKLCNVLMNSSDASFILFRHVPIGCVLYTITTKAISFTIRPHGASYQAPDFCRAVEDPMPQGHGLAGNCHHTPEVMSQCRAVSSQALP